MTRFTVPVTSFLLLGFVSAPGLAQQPFDAVLQLNGFSFHVQCPNNSSINPVTLQASGLEREQPPITREADGTLVGADIADLNRDGSPEIYLYVQSAGSGSYGSLLAWSVNNRKSLTEIYLPALDDDPVAAEGYMGHDQFQVTQTRLLRQFPVYAAGDINAAPSGGIRQISYRLTAGEAGWVLRPEQVSVLADDSTIDR